MTISHQVMTYLVSLMALLFGLSDCAHAQESIPGSYRIEYGGIYKVFMDQARATLRTNWIDYEESIYLNGYSNFETFMRKRNQINIIVDEWKNGLPWYYRNWWHSLSEKRGGAPQDPLVIERGHTKILIDLGVVYITNAFQVKWRGLELTIDFEKQSSITFDIGREATEIKSGWKFKFHPELKVNMRRLLKEPLNCIRRVGLNIGGVHTVRGRDIVAIFAFIWRNFEERDTYFGIQLKLLQW